MNPNRPARPMKAYRCRICVRIDVTKLWVCRGCERRLCIHGMSRRYLDGGGVCRKCYRKARKTFAANHPAMGEAS